jgi:preprotein translocase subunit YajC
VTPLLKDGADVNTQGGLFGTVLQAAASRDEEEIGFP